ncbi:MAG: hypothetical protein JJU21_03135 [Salinarimonas sp.]|nr:hypothetical protein [Salinarimonas sp.]
MADQGREARLKAALRENLKRRKQQARKRATADGNERDREDTGAVAPSREAPDEGKTS